MSVDLEEGKRGRERVGYGWIKMDHIYFKWFIYCFWLCFNSKVEKYNLCIITVMNYWFI